MKKLFIIPVLCLLLAACTKKVDEPPDTIDNRDKGWWGYFDGTFDGTLDADDMTVSFKNEQFHTRTGSFFQSISYPAPGYDKELICLKNCTVEYIEGDTPKEGSYITMSLSGLVRSTKYVTKPKRMYENWDEYYISTLCLLRHYPGQEGHVYFVPREDDPFVVIIRDVVWSFFSNPNIEARLTGTLYRQDDPRQSITIDAVCGIGCGLNLAD